MKNCFNILLLMGIANIFLGCNPAAESPVSTSGTSAFTESLPPSKWISNSRFPLNLKISDQFNSQEVAAIQASGSAWSSSVNDELNFFNTSNTTSVSKSTLNSYEDGEFGVYKLHTWPSELPGMALAVTQIFGMRRNIGSASEYIEIQHADILVNYDYFSFTTDGSWGYDLETVILHEMGHFLGLYHDESSSDESVMYPSISRYVDNKTPKTKDADKLRTKYLGLSASRSLIPQHHGDSEPIQFQLELYPGNVERIKIIKRGDKNEKGSSYTHYIKCNHKH